MSYPVPSIFYPVLAAILAGVFPDGPIMQRVGGKADVQIRTLEVTKTRSGLTVRVVVYTEHDDEARDARLLILLPVGAGIQKMVAGCSAPASTTTPVSGATVLCKLGSIADRGFHEVLVAISTPSSKTPSRLGVFAYSATPDPQPGNNYAERVLR